MTFDELVEWIKKDSIPIITPFCSHPVLQKWDDKSHRLVFDHSHDGMVYMSWVDTELTLECGEEEMMEVLRILICTAHGYLSQKPPIDTKQLEVGYDPAFGKDYSVYWQAGTPWIDTRLL